MEFINMKLKKMELKKQLSLMKQFVIIFNQNLNGKINKNI